MNDRSAVNPGGNLLIVDDTPANLHLLSQLLTGCGYQVRAVLNGARALTAAQAAPPDLILLDIMMPEMDGYEVCQRLKADERTRDIPILFISALSETGEKVKGFTAGGVDYITKPFQSEEVLARVQTHLTLRNLQKRLQQEIVERDQLISELDAFSHTVAHDLKNPLGVIIGYADLLSEYEDMPSDQIKNSLQSIWQTGQKMNNIIEELMLLAGVRKQQVALEPLDMAGIVQEARKRLTALIQRYEAEISLPDTWPQALGYGPWVEEVWTNYISNASKYGGHPPCIELGATVQPDGMIRLWVHDNGAGLTPEQRASLFVPFTRLDQARATGHGLGLSIVHRIVEKLGGQVGVESEGVPGRGSTFYFTLPEAAA